jgi:hypothetical protein
MASSLACSNWRHIGARNPQQRNLRPPRHPLAAELFSCLGRAQRVKFLDEGLAILLVHPLNVLEDGEKAFGGGDVVTDAFQISNKLQLLGDVRYAFDDMPVDLRQFPLQLSNPLRAHRVLAWATRPPFRRVALEPIMIYFCSDA